MSSPPSSRYAQGRQPALILNNAKGWDAPDPETFVIHMKVAQPEPSIESLSSFRRSHQSSIPAEERDVPAMQLTKPTRHPARSNSSSPSRAATVKLKRYDGYQPNDTRSSKRPASAATSRPVSTPSPSASSPNQAPASPA